MINTVDLLSLDIADESKKLLEESFICYSNSIYRAAFILAYLAFKVTIKYRLLKGKKPDEVQESLWNSIMNKLNDDNEWDDKVNEIVMASEKNGKGVSSIFKFNDYNRIKTRYQYWRDVRNSCVHAKTENFTESLIRYFYDYLLQDLPNYYVLGGKQYILNVIKDEYNNNQYYKDAEINKSLSECKLIYKNNLVEFVNDFIDDIKNDDYVFCNNKIVKNMLNNSEYRQACAKYIANDLSDIQKDNIWFNSDIRLIEDVYNENEKSFQKNVIPNILAFKSNFPLDYKIVIRIIYVTLNKCSDFLVNSNPIFNDLGLSNQVISENDHIIVDLFKKHKLFNTFLENAGKYYFDTSASSLYHQFCNFQQEDTIEPLFDYIEWNKSIIEKLNIAANFPYELTNENSKLNKERRLNSIKNVYYKNKYIIDEIIKNENLDVPHLMVFNN